MFVYIALAVVCMGGSAMGGCCDLPPIPAVCNPNGCAGLYPGHYPPWNKPCPTNPFYHLMLAHPTDCTKFCTCTDGGTNICEQACPAGTRFDSTTQGCVEDDCGSSICHSDPCRGGFCIPHDNSQWPRWPTNYECAVCQDGYWGEYCQFRDACYLLAQERGGNDPCEPNEQCFQVGDSAECRWDPCVSKTPNPVCWENAQCTANADWTDFTCACPAACWGKRCDCNVNVYPNPCDNNPCQNGGTCYAPLREEGTDAVDCTDYECKCHGTWYGKNCDVDVCRDISCQPPQLKVRHPEFCDHYCECRPEDTSTAMTRPCAPGTYFNEVFCQCWDFTCQQAPVATPAPTTTTTGIPKPPQINGR